MTIYTFLSSRNLFKQKNVLSTQPEVGLHVAAIDQVLTILCGTCRMSRGVCLTSLERRRRRGRPTYCGGDWHVLEWVCYGCVADSNEKDLGEDAPPCSQNCLSSKATQVYVLREQHRQCGTDNVLYKTLFLTAGLVAPHTELTTPTALAETPNFVPTVIYHIILFVAYQILNQFQQNYFYIDRQ